MWQSNKSHLISLRVVVIFVIFLTNYQCDNKLIRDFSIGNYLPDGEIETRVYYKGITGKETTVAKGSVDDVKFHQLTDNHTLIQLIYNNDELKDCEILHRKQQIVKFLNKFKNDLNYLLTTSNLTIENLDNQQLTDRVDKWFDFARMKRNCKDLHRKLKKQIANTHKITTQRLHKIRGKRSMLIMPGTLWCGSATNADSYTQLGHMSKTDRCCRRHDYCKVAIPGLTTKFNYYNHSPFTLSHCYCDKSFRTCLKMVDTSDANLVGKLFFNVVQTKCFIIKPKKRCIKMSWWGKCEKFKYEKQAILRDNLPY